MCWAFDNNVPSKDDIILTTFNVCGHVCGIVAMVDRLGLRKRDDQRTGLNMMGYMLLYRTPVRLALVLMILDVGLNNTMDQHTPLLGPPSALRLQRLRQPQNAPINPEVVAEGERADWFCPRASWRPSGCGIMRARIARERAGFKPRWSARHGHHAVKYTARDSESKMQGGVRIRCTGIRIRCVSIFFRNRCSRVETCERAQCRSIRMMWA